LSIALLPDQIRQVADASAIRDQVARYCRGVDRKDGALIVAAFHPDAVIDHGAWKGSPTELARLVVAGEMPQSMHFLGTQIVDFGVDDKALCESYFVSFQGFAREGARWQRVRAGRYLDRFERRTQWRITSRLLVDDWSRVDRVDATVEGIGVHSSLRSHTDALFPMLGALKRRP
jgi:hypothetical protein